MKTIRRIYRLINSMRFFRRLKNSFYKKSTVRIKHMINFEQACKQNLEMVSDSKDIGLLYMGRFGDVKHQFVCVDRKKFLYYLRDIDCCEITAKGNNVFHKNINYMLLRLWPKKTGYIDVYRRYITPAEVVVFGLHEAVRIHFPKVLDDYYILGEENPVIRKISRKNGIIENGIKQVSIEGCLLDTLQCFYDYIKYDSHTATEIDLVYTWVNGLDFDWQIKKNKIMSDQNAILHPTAISNSRFKHIDELLYSIRSVFMFTNFVRNIYIVTDDQRPEWLNNNEKVVVIDHKEIFPNDSVLPTFNSHAIETCLHKIPGLSKNFLYLNDDILFGRSVTLKKFFTSNMFPVIYYSDQAFIPYGDACSDDLPVDSAAKNARSFFLDNYGVWLTRKFKHVPCPVNIDEADQLECALGENIINTRSKKFRTSEDFSFLTCAYYHWMDKKGKVGTNTLSYGYVDVNNFYELVRLRMRFMQSTNKRWDVFCLNDVDGDGHPRANKKARVLLKEFYSMPSPIEILK